MPRRTFMIPVPKPRRHTPADHPCRVCGTPVPCRMRRWPWCPVAPDRGRHLCDRCRDHSDRHDSHKARGVVNTMCMHCREIEV